LGKRVRQMYHIVPFLCELKSDSTECLKTVSDNTPVGTN
jgi:hypothetical protein